MSAAAAASAASAGYVVGSSQSVGRRRAEVVRLLEHDLTRRVILVVLVRRVARPVARRREDLDHEETLRGEVGLQEMVDLPRRVAGAAHLDLDVGGLDELRLAPPLGAGAADRELAVSCDAVRRVAREVQRPRQPGEDVVAAAELP